MKNTLQQSIRTFVKDERGGAIIEYALVAGLIIIACITTIALLGTRLMARWNSVNASAI